MKKVNEGAVKEMMYKIAKKIATVYLERYGDTTVKKGSIPKKALDKIADTILDEHKAKLYYDAFDQIANLIKDEIKDEVVTESLDKEYIMPLLNEYDFDNTSNLPKEYAVIGDLKDGTKEIIEYVDSAEAAEELIKDLKNFAGDKFGEYYEEVKFIPTKDIPRSYYERYFKDSTWEDEK